MHQWRLAFIWSHTAQKMMFSIKGFVSKCDQIRSFLRIWSHLLKKSLMKSFIFLCSVTHFFCSPKKNTKKILSDKNCLKPSNTKNCLNTKKIQKFQQSLLIWLILHSPNNIRYLVKKEDTNKANTNKKMSKLILRIVSSIL